MLGVKFGVLRASVQLVECFALPLIISITLLGRAQALRLSAHPEMISAGDTFAIRVEFDTETAQAPAEDWDLQVLSSKLNEVTKTVDLTLETLQHSSNVSFYHIQFFTISSGTASRRDSKVLNVVPGTILEIQLMSMTQHVRVALNAGIRAPSIASPGNALEISVEDPFLFQSGHVEIDVALHVSCTVISPFTNSGRPDQGVEMIKLHVSPSDVHVFSGSIATFEQTGSLAPHSAANDGALDLKGPAPPQNGGHCSQDIITVTYVPLATAQRPPTAPREVTAYIRVAYLPVLTTNPAVVSLDQTNRSVEISLQDANEFAASGLQVSINVPGIPPMSIISLSRLNGTTAMFRGTFTPTRDVTGMPAAQNPVLVDYGSSIILHYEGQHSTVRAFATVAQDAIVALFPSVVGVFPNQNVATIAAGVELTIRLEDADSNQDPASHDTVFVSIAVRDGARVREVGLIETGPSTGSFTGEYIHDGSVQAAADAFLTVTYSDAASASGASSDVVAEARVASVGSIACRGSLVDTSTFAIGDTISVTVVDPDLDQFSAGPDITGTGRVGDRLRPVMAAMEERDVEAFVLRETGSSSGVFTGELATSMNVGNEALYDGSLYTGGTGIVQISYYDLNPESIVDCRLRVQSIGVVSTSAPSVLPGSSLLVTVTDADLNTNPFVQESHYVHVQDGNGDQVQVALLETGLDEAEFVGSITVSISNASVPAPEVYIQAIGDPIVISYNDSSPVGVRQPAIVPRVGVAGNVSASPRVVGDGTVLAIAVEDADLNTDPAVVESHSNLVTARSEGGEAFAVIVTETSPDSSVFTGNASAVAGGGSGVLSVRSLSGIESAAIEIEYADPTAGASLSVAELQTERTGVLTVTQIGADDGKFSIGGNIAITVADGDLDSSIFPDSHDLLVTFTVGTDFEQISLSETGAKTGIFTGEVPTSASSTVTASDGVLSGLSTLDVVTAGYADANPAQGTILQIEAGYAGQITTNPTFVLSSTASMTVTVVDPDLNTDSGAAEDYTSQEILWYRFENGDQNFVDLVEAGTDSSTFTGSLSLPQSPPRSPGSRMTFTYLDPEVGNPLGGAVRSAVNTNPVRLVLVFATDGGDGSGNGPSVSGPALLSRDEYCPDSLKWAGLCGPTSACGESALCGRTDASASGTESLLLAAGSVLGITVVDQDRNVELLVPELVRVWATSAASDDSVPAFGSNTNPFCRENDCFSQVQRGGNERLQTITLLENGIDTGVFTGELWTRDSPSINTATSGYMNVGMGDQITLTYEDEPTSSSQSPVNLTRLVKITKAGSPGRILTRSSVVAGAVVSIEVFDPDLVGSATPADAVKLQLIGANGVLKQEEESLALQPVPGTTGLYRTSIETAVEPDGDLHELCVPTEFTPDPTFSCQVQVVPEDGTLAVSVGDLIVVTYSDAAPFAPVSVSISVAQPNVAVAEIAPRFVAPGQELSVTVTDADLDADSQRAEQTSGQLRAGEQALDLILTETGASTGIFTSSVPTASTDVPSGNAMLTWMAGLDVVFQVFDAAPYPVNVTSMARFESMFSLEIAPVKERGTLHVRLLEPDVIRVAGQPLSLNVDVRAGAIVTSLALFETGLETGEFSGDISLWDGNASIPGILGDLFAGDNITVSYTSPFSVGRGTTASAVVGRSFEGVISTIPVDVIPGRPVVIRLDDGDLNVDPFHFDTVAVRVRSGRFLERRFVLRESGRNTGTFLKEFSTRADGRDADGIEDQLFVVEGDVMTILYSDAAPQARVEKDVNVSAAAPLQMTLAPLVLRQGARLDIQVVDSQRNVDMAQVDVATVLVQARAPGPSIPVPLLETGLDTDVFTGSILTDSSNGLVSDLHPRVNSDVGDVLTFSYSGSGIPIFSTKEVHGSSPGTTTIGDGAQFQYGEDLLLRAITAGDLVTVTVTDVDLNDCVTAVDSASVKVVSKSGIDQDVPVLETGQDTGVFTATVRTVTSESAFTASSVPTLLVQPGDLLQSVYIDEAPRKAIRSPGYVRASSEATLQIEPAPTRAGSLLTFFITDTDLDTSDSVRDSSYLTVASARNLDEEQVFIRETSEATGVFTGMLQTLLSQSIGTRNSSFLTVSPGEVLSITFLEPPTNEPKVFTAAVLPSELGLISASPRAPIGERISITVYDADFDLAPDTADETTVQLSEGGRSTPYVSITLVETAVDSGVFTAQILADDVETSEPIRKLCTGEPFEGQECLSDLDCGAGLCNHWILAATASVLLQAETTACVSYEDSHPDGFTTRSAFVQLFPRSQLTASPSLFVAGEPVALRLGDFLSDVSDTPDVASIRVSLASGAEHDSLVKVFETGDSTAVFTGFLVTDSATSPQALNVSTGDTFTLIADAARLRGADVTAAMQVATRGQIEVDLEALRFDGVLTVTVDDADLLHLGTTSVPVRMSSGSQSRQLDLMASAEVPGRFTASVLLWNSGDPPVQEQEHPYDSVFTGLNVFDFVLFSYMDSNPPMEASTSRELLASQVGAITVSPTIFEGASIEVSVHDADRCVDISNKDAIMVSVTSTNGDFETLELIENDFHSCLFTGSLPSVSSAVTILNNGILEAEVADNITVAYFDSSPYGVVSRSASIVHSATGILSLSRDNLAPGTSASLTLTDPDVASDELAVTLTWQGTDSAFEVYELVLTRSETSAFVGSIAMRSDEEELQSHIIPETEEQAAAQAKLPRLPDATIITIMYADTAPAVTVTTTLITCSVAMLEIRPATIGIGSSPTVVVKDSDLVGPDVTVFVTNVETGESIDLMLLMSEPGMYEGTFDVVDLETGSSSSTALAATKNSNIEVAFFDLCPVGERKVYGTTWYVGTISVSPSELKSGAELLVQVDDLDLNNDELVQETVSVVCKSGDKSTVLTLEEVAVSSSLFETRIHVWERGAFYVPGTEILCEYIDETPNGKRTAMALVQESEVAEVTLTPEWIGVGGLLFVTIQDSDLSFATNVIDQDSVSVTASSELDSKLITIVETGPNTGLFTGVVVTDGSPTYGSASGNGGLMVQPGSTVTVTYAEKAPQETREVQSSVIASFVGEIVLVPEPIGINSRIEVGVIDPDLKLYGNETLLQIHGASNTLDLTLRQSEDDPDFYEAVFFTVLQTLQTTTPGPMELLVQEGQTVTATYEDVGPDARILLTTEVVATTLGSISVSPFPALPGQNLTITLVDADYLAAEIPMHKLVVEGPSIDVDFERNEVVGSVEVYETGPGSGVYTGLLLPLLQDDLYQQRQEQTDNGAFRVRYGDILTVRYEDALPLQQVSYDIKVAGIGVLTATPLATNGETVIRVFDPDLDDDESVSNSWWVTVESTRAPAPKNVTLTETGLSTGDFTGVLQTRPVAVPTSSAALGPVDAEDEVTIVYSDVNPVGCTALTLLVTSEYNGSLTISSPRIIPGDSIAITVDDGDLNYSPYHLDTTTAVVTTTRVGEGVENVLLTETALNGTIFTGMLLTHIGDLNTIANNGVMDVDGGDLLTITYREAAPARTWTEKVKIATEGSVSVQPSLVNSGGTISITVQDFDLNTGELSVQTSTCTVQSASGDVESVTVTEISIDSSTFTGELQTQTSTAQVSHVLSGATEGSLITVTYSDALPSVPHSVTAQVASVGLLSISPTQISPDAPVGFTVTDPDMNLDPAVINNISVTAESLCSEQTQNGEGRTQCNFDAANFNILGQLSITLLETGEDTSTFTGSIDTVSNVSNPRADALVTPSGSMVQLSYTDTNPTPITERTERKRVTGIGALFALPSRLNEFGTISITLEDADLDLTDGFDTNCGTSLLSTCPAPVRVIGPSTNTAGDPVLGWTATGLNILLLETAAHSGIFTGEIPTTSAIFNTVQSGIVAAAEEGAYITVTYEDAYPAGQRTSVVRVAAVGDIQVPAILAADEVLSITVVDSDGNNDPASIESISVQVEQNTKSPFASEAITLLEQGRDSNVFVANLPTTTDSLSIPAGYIHAPSGSTVVVTYLDHNPTPNTTRTAVYVSTVGNIDLTCSDGTWDVCTAFKVVVLDEDLNTDSGVTESIASSVVLYNQRGQESETLTLTELSADSSSFQATLDAVDTDVGDCGCGLCPDCIGTGCCATSEDGELFISAGDTVQAVYLDSSPSAYIKETRVVPSLGAVAFSGSAQIIGNSLAVELRDVDLGVDETPLITLQATRTSSADAELLYLTSTATQGSFTGVLPTEATHSFAGNNGVLELDKNDVLSAIYQDYYPLVPSQDTLSIDRGVSEYPQFLGVLEVSPYPAMLVDGIVSITVKDYDLDQNAQAIEFDGDWSSRTSTVVTVDVCIPILVNGELECDPIGSEQRVTLVETATGILESGTFTGSIQTFSRDDAPSGLAGAQAGYVVRVSYADYTTQQTVSASIQVASPAIVQFDRTLPFSSAGAPLMVTLVDIEDTLPGTELRSRQVTVDSGGQSQSLELTETALGTGYYTGALRSTVLLDETYRAGFRPNCPPHAQLLAGMAVGGSVSVSYTDPSPALVASDTLILGGETGSVALSAETIPFVPGNTISVTVMDADLNTDPYQPDIGISGRLRVFGYGWNCGTQFPTCSPLAMADGSGIFQNCSGFPSASHPCVLNADFEDVVLSEDSRNSGVFTGTIPTSPAAAAKTPGDGMLFCGSEIPESVTLRAVYLDESPAGNMNEAFIRGRSDNIMTIHGADLDTSYFSIGESLSITVQDLDSDVDPCGHDFITITLNTSSIPAGNDAETLNLTETGLKTGVFTGSLATSSATILQQDGELQGLVKNDVVSAMFVDPVSSDVLITQTTASHAGSLSDTYALLFPGSTLQITLVDEDLNVDDVDVGEMVENLVIVSTSKDTETEVITLREQASQSNPTGTFVALLQTAEELDRGREDSGLLHVLPGDLLTITYTDAAPRATRRIHVRVATLGSLTLSPSLPATDTSLLISVNDLDRDLESASADQTSVTVYKQPNTHTKTVTLRETGLSTGLFTGSVLLSSDPPSTTPEILGGCAAGDTVYVIYTDELPLQTVLATTSVYEIGKLSLSSPWVEAGLNISLTIVDGDMNQDPAAVESITSSSQMLWVTTTFPAPGDLEYVYAQETGPDTGVFTAEIMTSANRFNAQVENNGIIEPFDPSYFATIRYYDLAPREDRIIVSRSSTIGEVSASPTLVGAGTPLSITVDDIDLDFDENAADSTFVLLTTSKAGEGTETVSLVETGSSTGRFTGTIETRRTALLGEQDDGTLNVLAGHTITISYSDGSPVNETKVCRDDALVIMLRTRCTNDATVCTGGASDCYDPRQFTVTVGVFGVINLDTGTVLASSVAATTDIGADVLMLASSSVSVTVIDSDLNTDPASVQNYETVILATGAAGGNNLDIEIIESGVDTKVFTGTVFTSPTVVAGALFVGSGSGQSTLATFTYSDPTGSTKLATARLQTQASIVLSSGGSSTTLRLGDPLSITAYDGDRDLSSTEPDTIDVIVLSSTENLPLADVGHEPLTLTERGVNSGEFTGTIPTTVGAMRRDGVISVEMPSDPGCQCSEICGCTQCADSGCTGCDCITTYIRVRYDDPSPAGHRAETSIAVVFPGVLSVRTSLPPEGGYVDITVTDPDLNLQSGVQESASLSLMALASQNAVSHANTSVTLQETALSSGVFTGTVLLCTACTSNSTALNVSQDITRYLAASYEDASHFMEQCTRVCDVIGQCSATCTDVPAIRSVTAEVSALGKLRADTFIASADTLHVSVTDPDRNRFDSVEEVNVTLAAYDGGGCVSQAAACGQVLALTETSISSGLFTGVVSLQRVSAPCSDASFNLQTLCTSLGTGAEVILTYEDSYPSGSVTETKALFCDAVLTVPRVFVPGVALQLTVQDCDMDTTAAADTLQVTVTSRNSSGHTIDSETVQLTETALTSGYQATFTGTLPTTSNVAAVAADDGQLFSSSSASDGTPVQVLYLDTETSSSKQPSTTSDAKACATATMTLTQTLSGVQLPDSFFATNHLLDVTVTDGARNLDPSIAETARVRGMIQLQTGETDIEDIELTENGLDSSVFTGRIGVDESRILRRHDSTLAPVVVGQQATLEYLDACSNTSVAVDATCIDIGSIHVDSPVSLRDGSTVYVSILDADLNANNSIVETYTGLLSLSFGGDSEDLTLTEDGTNSSTFKAQIAVSNSVLVLGDGLLYLDCEGEVRCNMTVTYNDAQFGAVVAKYQTSTRGAVSITSAGLSGSELLAGQQLSITVRDADWTEGSTAFVTTDTGDRETITLTETAPSSGIFTATLDTLADSTALKREDKRLSPLFEGTVILVSYPDRNPRAHTQNVSLVATSPGVLSVLPNPTVWSSLVQSPVIDISLTRASLNQDAASFETALVSIVSYTNSSPAVTDQRQVVLNETAPGSAIFTGAISISPSPVNNTSLLLQESSHFEVWHELAGLAESTWTRVQRCYARAATGPTSAVIPFVDPPSPRSGGLLLITVVDTDADTRWEEVETLQVTVSSSKIAEGVETVVLTEMVQSSTLLEDGLPQGTFTGSLLTIDSATASGAEDARLNTQPGDEITVTYLESAWSDGTPRTRSNQVLVGMGGTVGRMVLSPALVFENESLCVSIYDDDPFHASDSTRQVELELSRTLPNGTIATSSMQLNASGVSPYTGCIPTFSAASTEEVSNTSRPASLEYAVRGQRIAVTYHDEVPVTSVTNYAFISRKGVVTAEPFVSGLDRIITITVRDPDLNEDATQFETASVAVSTSWHGEGAEAVTLTEAGRDSELFTARIRTVENTVQSPEQCALGGGTDCVEPFAVDQALHVREGDVIAIRYQDAALGTSYVEPMNELVAYVHVGVTGTVEMYGCVPPVFPVDEICSPVLHGGEPLKITVTDPDLALEPNKLENRVVTVSTSKDSEVEEVLLTETASGSQVFTGLLDTCMGEAYCTPRAGVDVGTFIVSEEDCLECRPNLQGRSNNGVLTVRHGDLLTVSYRDQMPIATRTAHVKVARVGVLRLNPTSYTVPGTSIALTVIDDDVNVDPLAADSTTVTVLAPILGEPPQVITLVESGADTGHFVAEMSTCIGCTSSTGVMPVEEGDLLSFVYSDAHIPSVEAAASATVQLTLTVSYLASLTAQPTIIEAGDAVTVSMNNKDTRFVTDELTLTAVTVPSTTAERETVTLNAVQDTGTLSIVWDATSVSLDFQAPAIDDYYVDGLLVLNGESRTIIQYVGESRRVYVNPAWDINDLNANMPYMIERWGLYRGILQTRKVAVGHSLSPVNEILDVTPGQEIVLSYNDLNPSDPQFLTILVANESSVTAFLRITFGGPSLVVQVSDFDMNQDPTAAEFVIATARSARGEEETLNLKETGVDTAIFEGYLSVVFSDRFGVSNDGALHGLPRDTVSVEYREPRPTQVIRTFVDLGFAATLDVRQPNIPAGFPLHVTVVDGDLNLDARRPDAVDVNVELLSRDNGVLEDTENVVLLETGRTTNIFTAAVPTQLLQPGDPATALDGVLQTSLYAEITLQYLEGYPAGTRSVSTTSQHLAEISFEFSMQAVNGNDESYLDVTLIDYNLAAGGSVNCDVSAPLDQETVVLASTGVGSFTFTGSILVTSPQVAEAADALTLDWDHEMSLSYDDALPEETSVLTWRAPAPDFVFPSPSEGEILTAAPDCGVLVLLLVEDMNGFGAEMVPTRYMVSSDWHGIAPHHHGMAEAGTSGLLPGSSLVYTATYIEERFVPRELDPLRVGVQTATFTWIPTTRDMGKVFTQCFLARNIHKAGVARERCFRVHVERCSMCTEPGDTLATIAEELGTDWKLLWSLNKDLESENHVAAGTRLRTGMFYTARDGDTVETIGKRFGILLELLFAGNPDAKEVSMMPGSRVCLSPLPGTTDFCPPPAKSSTWEPIEEQYVPPDYLDNPFNWEAITYTDPRGIPTKEPNPLYPQRPNIA